MGCCYFSPKRFGCGPTLNAGGSAGALTRVVEYTAVGGETDFQVPIGFAMPSDSYSIACALRVATNTVIPVFPDEVAGDRTTTTFRCVVDALTAGDKLEFSLTPR